MPDSERPTGILRIAGPPAVRIEVIDGAFQKVAEGTRLVTRALPEGIYTVRWLGGAEGPEEQTIRLFPSDEPVTLSGGGLTEEASRRVQFGDDVARRKIITGDRSIVAVDFLDAVGRGQGIALEGIDQAGDPEPPGDGEICVEVEPAEGKIQSNPARTVRLLSLDGTAIEAVSEGRGRQLRGRGRPARIMYRVTPGTYRLRCHAAEHRWVEQTICAFPGRRTILFMRYGRSYEMRIRHGERVRAALRGIDPAASLAVSVPIGQDGMPARGDFQLHETLLQGLAGGAAIIDGRLAEGLARLGTDPYAKLYGAALALLRTAGGTAAREPIDGGMDADALTGAAQRIVRSMRMADCPDLQCMRGWLGEEEEDDAAAPLAAPPMLARSWQWAVEWSVRRPGVLPASPQFDAAADAQSTYFPWLVWNVADAKAVAAEERFDPLLLAHQVIEIDRGMRALRDRLGEADADLLLTGGGHLDLPIGLSDASVRLVDDLERVRIAFSAKGEPAPGVHDMITYLGMPAESLQRRAEVALTEIGRAQEEWG